MIAEPVWITEHDVVDLVDLTTAVIAVESAFQAEARGAIAAMAKTHVPWEGGNTLHALGAVDLERNLVATKTWTHAGGSATPLLIMWSARTGALLAVIEAFALGQLRTAAVTSVATHRLAAPRATHLAIIGSGKQALAQAAAVAAARDIEQITVFSPTRAHSEAFAHRLDGLALSCRIELATSVEEAVRGADVVTTATRAREPFLHAAWLAPGSHVNAIGAITPERHEIAADVVARASVIAADNAHAARHLSGELGTATAITRLCDIVAAGDEFDRGTDVSVFKAMGVGLADLAVGAEVLERSLGADLGRRLPAPVRPAPRFNGKEI